MTCKRNKRGLRNSEKHGNFTVSKAISKAHFRGLSVFYLYLKIVSFCTTYFIQHRRDLSLVFLPQIDIIEFGGAKYANL